MYMKVQCFSQTHRRVAYHFIKMTTKYKKDVYPCHRRWTEQRGMGEQYVMTPDDQAGTESGIGAEPEEEASSGPVGWRTSRRTRKPNPRVVGQMWQRG
jgi:hypothetical protein